jgi:hypothetical protein
MIVLCLLAVANYLVARVYRLLAMQTQALLLNQAVGKAVLVHFCIREYQLGHCNYPLADLISRASQ